MLADAIKNLSKHSLVYACSSYLSKLIGFFLIPFYTYYLPPKPYGKVELFDFTIIFIGHLIGINICQAMTKYFLASDDPDNRRKVAGTALIFSTLASFVAIGILSLFSGDFSEIFFKTRERYDWVIIVFLNLFLTVITHQCFSYLQTNRLSKWFLIISVGKLVLEVGGRIFFIAVLDMGILGVFLGSLAGGGPFAVALLLVILWKNRFRFSFQTLKVLLIFTFPLIFSGIGQVFLHGIDKYLVFFRAPDGETATGIYSIAYKFGYLANSLVVSPFLLIWWPYILSVREDSHVRLICSRIQTYFTLLVGFSSLVFAIYSREMVQIMTEPEFHSAYRAVPFVLLGYLFWAMFQIAQTPFFTKSKTRYLPWIIGLAVAFNFGLNYHLTSAYGFMGAAVVTALTFAFLFGITYLYARRLLPINYEWKRLVMIFAVGLFLYFLSFLIPDWGFVPVVLCKAILLILFPIALFFIGFPHQEERERVSFLFKLIRRGPKGWRDLIDLRTWFR